jgi:hypothetical protein
LPLDQPLGEAFERSDEEVLDRAEVVVDEAVIEARLFGKPSRRDAGVADVDEQPLGRVEERVLGGRTGRGLVSRFGQGATRSRTRMTNGLPCDGVTPMSSPQLPLIPSAGTVRLYAPGAVCRNRVVTSAISMSSIVNVV